MIDILRVSTRNRVDAARRFGVAFRPRRVFRRLRPRRGSTASRNSTRVRAFRAREPACENQRLTTLRSPDGGSLLCSSISCFTTPGSASVEMSPS